MCSNFCSSNCGPALVGAAVPYIWNLSTYGVGTSKEVVALGVLGGLCTTVFQQYVFSIDARKNGDQHTTVAKVMKHITSAEAREFLNRCYSHVNDFAEEVRSKRNGR